MRIKMTNRKGNIRLYPCVDDAHIQWCKQWHLLRLCVWERERERERGGRMEMGVRGRDIISWGHFLQYFSMTCLCFQFAFDFFLLKTCLSLSVCFETCMEFIKSSEHTPNDQSICNFWFYSLSGSMQWMKKTWLGYDSPT